LWCNVRFRFSGRRTGNPVDDALSPARFFYTFSPSIFIMCHPSLLKSPGLLRGIALIPLFAFSAFASEVSKPPANVTLRPIVAPGSVQPAPSTYELVLKWDDRSTNVLTVPFKNDSDKTLKIVGVQATRGIFISDYPETVGAKKEESVSFVYRAADNTDGDADLIRVLTDQGIKEVLLKIVREEAVQFDTKEVRWAVGAVAETKTVTITVAASTVTPLKVRASSGHLAVLEPVNATTWRVRITPGSTAKLGRFSVIVDFDKALPGKSAVILGVIQPTE
jgi:hypothetical protein